MGVGRRAPYCCRYRGSKAAAAAECRASNAKTRLGGSPFRVDGQSGGLCGRLWRKRYTFPPVKTRNKTHPPSEVISCQEGRSLWICGGCPHTTQLMLLRDFMSWFM